MRKMMILLRKMVGITAEKHSVNMKKLVNMINKDVSGPLEGTKHE